jgi:hypothetical protein
MLTVVFACALEPDRAHQASNLFNELVDPATVRAVPQDAWPVDSAPDEATVLVMMGQSQRLWASAFPRRVEWPLLDPIWCHNDGNVVSRRLVRHVEQLVKLEGWRRRR